MLRSSLAALGLAVLLAVPGSGALAAPSNAPSSSTFPVQCGGSAFLVTINAGQSGTHGQGNPTIYSPAFIDAGGSGLAIPLMISGSFYDPNGNLLGSFSSTKGNAQVTSMQQETCTFTESQNGYTFDGTVLVALNPNANTAH